MPDHLIRAMYRSSTVRLVAAVTTELSREAKRRHGASPWAACALSRAMSSTLVLATLTRGGERVTMQLLCDGPLRGITVDTYDDGDVRAYPHEPRASLDHPPRGRQRLADLLGRSGVVNIVRDLGLKERYQGQIALSTSEIDEDIEAYLRVSEQIPSALGAEVVMDAEGEILVAGAFLAQAMPEGDVAPIRALQHAARDGTLFRVLEAAGAQATAEGLIGALLSGEEIDLASQDRRLLRFRCRCDMARIEAMLKTLSPVDIDEMIGEGQAEVSCNYCGEKYLLLREALLHIRAQMSPRESN